MSITYPPEMLPSSDGDADVIVVNNDGSERKVMKVTEDMVTRAINALVYTGYTDEAQIRVIRRQATCREYVRRALEAALQNL